MFEYTEEAKAEIAAAAKALIEKGIRPSDYAVQEFIKVHNKIPATSPLLRRIGTIRLGFFAMYGAEKMLELLKKEGEDG